MSKSHKYLKSSDFKILEYMDDWVRVISRDGMILYANKKFRQAFSEDARGKHVLSYDRRNHIPIYAKKTALRAKKAIVVEEKIGREYYSLKISPILDEDGEVSYVIEVFRNITAETRVRQDLYDANKKMIDDIKLTKKIQTAILPEKKDYGNISIDYRYIPAGLLSGDIFDVFPIDESHLALYMADFVGHGVSASMMTMFIRQTVRSILDNHRTFNPSDLIIELQERFMNLRLDYENYFTFFFGKLNIKTGYFEYANAGHNCPPVWINRGEKKPLEIPGRPITQIASESPYSIAGIRMEESDSLLFYTDGILETRDEEKKVFGVGRLLKLLDDEDRILDRLVDAVNDFRFGEQEDDIALLLVRVKDDFHENKLLEGGN